MKTNRTSARGMAFCAFLLTLFSIPALRAQTTWFEDGFMRATLGSSWKPATGSWSIGNGVVSLSTKDYDQLLASSFYAYDLQPFSIEVTLRGIRAGIYFSLDDTASKVLSHMVR